MKKQLKNLVLGVLTLTISVLFCFIVVEVYLRLTSPPEAEKTIIPNRYYMNQPYINRIFYPKFMPGIYGSSKFHTNRDGIRGTDIDENAYKILCVGGSTTICEYLDNTETWPHLLMQKLNREDSPVWVGNAGKAGLNTWHHILQVKYLLPQTGADLVIILCGINDQELFIRHFAEIESLPDSTKFKQELLNKAFYSPPRNSTISLPWYKKLVLWRRASFFRNKYYNPELSLLENLVNLPRVYNKLHDLIQDGFARQDEIGKWYDILRKKRQAAEKIDTPPKVMENLDKALQLYGNNIIKITEICRKNKARVVFLTQPTLWRKNNSPEEENRLWNGVVGGSYTTPNLKYLSTASLEVLMNAYNKKLISVCRQAGIDYIDLAKYIPKSLELFYDDCHFTEKGAKAVAQVIADNLKKMGLDFSSGKVEGKQGDPSTSHK